MMKSDDASEFRCDPIGGAAVLAAMYSLEPFSPYVPSYQESSEAIALASTEDPLWPTRPDGSARTAAILVALAWHGSRFHPNLVDRDKGTMGLFGIRPPNPHISANMLLLPRTAAYVAIDLVRESCRALWAKTWYERLSHMLGKKESEGEANEEKMKAMLESMRRMSTADQILPKLSSRLLPAPSESPSEKATA